MHDILLNVDTNGQFNLLHGYLVCCEWKCQLLMTFGGILIIRHVTFSVSESSETRADSVIGMAVFLARQNHTRWRNSVNRTSALLC